MMKIVHFIHFNNVNNVKMGIYLMNDYIKINMIVY